MADWVSPIPGSDVRRAAYPSQTSMRLLRESWHKAEPHLPEISRLFYGGLFSLAPETRDFFPINMEVQRGRLVRALVHIIHLVDRPHDLSPLLRQLGRDHRKFGAVERHYQAVGTALLTALKTYLGPQWTLEVEQAWADAFTNISNTMRAAAAADTGPPLWRATVTEHRRVAWDLALIRLESANAIHFRPGQYFSVEVPHRPRLWRYLSPANAPRPDNSLEFHVRAVEGGWVSRAIVAHTRPGDVWRLGSSLGELTVDRKNPQPVLMIAGGTGVATMQSIVDYLAHWGENPEVKLFYGGRTSADLYDAEVLQGLASTNPWLRVIPVVENGPAQPNWKCGTLADVVVHYGAWSDHQVLISGSPQMIKATVASLFNAGISLSQIHYDPFTTDWR